LLFLWAQQCADIKRAITEKWIVGNGKYDKSNPADLAFWAQQTPKGGGTKVTVDLNMYLHLRDTLKVSGVGIINKSNGSPSYYVTVPDNAAKMMDRFVKSTTVSATSVVKANSSKSISDQKPIKAQSSFATFFGIKPKRNEKTTAMYAETNEVLEAVKKSPSMKRK